MTDRWDKSEITELARQGVPASKIVAKIGCSSSTVYTTIRRARQRGDLPPDYSNLGRPNSGQAHHLYLQNEVRRMLIEEAAIRGITVSRLCANLLRKVAQHQLAAAVLDDGFPTPPLPTKGSSHETSTNA